MYGTIRYRVDEALRNGVWVQMKKGIGRHTERIRAEATSPPQ
jgi:hypothetical protein